MKMPLDSKGNLLRHSEAKVQLLGYYLRNYLSITANQFDEISIYDMFCGPGLYGDSGEGSPITILRAIKEVYQERTRRQLRIPKVNCYFADDEAQNVESVNNAVKSNNLHDPMTGSLAIEHRKYGESLKLVLSKPYRPAEKRFIFLDPTGYKDVMASEIGKLLSTKTEVLLFLPIQFMYRFITNGTPAQLKEFISELTDYNSWVPEQSSALFALQIRDLFRSLFGPKVYVSTFMIEKDAHTVFCLYFFTTHLLGHVRWIDAKWKMDKDAGHGWSYRTVPEQGSLIPDVETFYLEMELLEFLKSGDKNNCDVFEFAVINKEYQSTHATKVCKKLVADGRLKIYTLSDAPIRANAFYINYDHYKDKNRKIQFEVI